jgi:hypothetical protein
LRKIDDPGGIVNNVETNTHDSIDATDSNARKAILDNLRNIHSGLTPDVNRTG